MKEEDGLEETYDLVVVGTGLVQSILASALARAGKTVLHVDSNDYYGGLDAVWTFPYLLEQSKKDPVQNFDISSNKDGVLKLQLQQSNGVVFHSVHRPSWPVKLHSRVHTPYGTGRVVALELKEEAYVRLCVELDGWRLADGQLAQVYAGVPSIQAKDGAVEPEYLWEHHGIRTSQAYIATDVLDQHSRSFALDLTPLLLYASGPAVDGLLLSKVSEYLEFKTLEGLLYMDSTRKLSRVPCSKNDVFASKLLTPMDKRRLMNFLQTALDFATSEALKEEEENASSDKLQSWNERHLNQGRSLSRPQNKAVASSDLEQLQKVCESDDLNFKTYLREDQRLSPSLTAIVRYAMALETQQASTRVGVRNLCSHLRALGRFGTTAFLVPLFGSGELSQSFCRSAAVFGATFLLRCSATSIVTDENKVQAVELSGAANKRISCSHVVVPDRALCPPATTQVIRRISILCGKPIGENQQQRHVIVIPPDTFVDQASTIHGIVLDEGVYVAPHGGCSLLHLTTTTDQAEVGERILQEALDSVLASSDVDEIFHVCFSYPLMDKDARKDISGLHVIDRPRPGLTADAAFEAAAALFAGILPDAGFLEVAKEVDEAIRQALGDKEEVDDETMVLESAVGMIQQPPKEADGTIESP